MDLRGNNSYDLWRLFIGLINAMTFLIILVFMYALLQDHIHAYISKPRFSKEQSEKIADRRGRVSQQQQVEGLDLIKNGIHVHTGLIADENLELIIGKCTPCHSAKLITQNRATRTGWKNMLVWMQETQGLPDLGKDEPLVLNYLAKHYAPTEVGRRENLDIGAIEWYILNLDDR
jgi:hypothetical protein